MFICTINVRDMNGHKSFRKVLQSSDRFDHCNYLYNGEKFISLSIERVSSSNLKKMQVAAKSIKAINAAMEALPVINRTETGRPVYSSTRAKLSAIRNSCYRSLSKITGRNTALDLDAIIAEISDENV
jgi:hypothetical protein